MDVVYSYLIRYIPAGNRDCTPGSFMMYATVHMLGAVPGWQTCRRTLACASNQGLKAYMPEFTSTMLRAFHHNAALPLPLQRQALICSIQASALGHLDLCKNL